MPQRKTLTPTKIRLKSIFILVMAIYHNTTLLTKHLISSQVTRLFRHLNMRLSSSFLKETLQPAIPLFRIGIHSSKEFASVICS